MSAPVIWWVRKDLRLADSPALTAALALGGPVVPVFVLDEVFSGYGACPRWRLGLGVEALGAVLEGLGSRLVLRRGRALDVLAELAEETGAKAVRWCRAYDAAQVARDKAVKAGLAARGVDAASVAGQLLCEPWDVETGQGRPYRVFTPYWRAVRGREVPAPLPRPGRIPAPKVWPASEAAADWGLAKAMGRGAAVVLPHMAVGEDAAVVRLKRFLGEGIAEYAGARDFPGRAGTSRLSENLAWGEISARACWHAGWQAMEAGARGAEAFLRELVWREFAYHLAWHWPDIGAENWRREWDGFPWAMDGGAPEVLAWKRGRTGLRLVDAAMRELYVTGTMHNRSRMVVASFLTKHLLTDWRVGLKWFADCLADWDPASNAMGWQWVAGSGPDAAPFFRIFNPEAQAAKFDPGGAYAGRWLAEGAAEPEPEALAYFDAAPRAWGLSAEDAYPEPVVDLGTARARALEAYVRRCG